DRGEGRFNPRGEWDQEDERPGRQVDARLDHRRGMDQGADRCRAFHRVREPGVYRELGGLADRATEQEERDEGEQLSVEQADERRDQVAPERAELLIDNRYGG